MKSYLLPVEDDALLDASGDGGLEADHAHKHGAHVNDAETTGHVRLRLNICPKQNTHKRKWYKNSTHARQTFRVGENIGFISFVRENAHYHTQLPDETMAKRRQAASFASTEIALSFMPTFRPRRRFLQFAFLLQVC